MLLDMDDVHLSILTAKGRTEILKSVSLTVSAGETVALVGESGSGKSTTARAALRLLPTGAELSGRVMVCGHDVSQGNRADVEAVRRGKAAMIFQEPRSALNPVRRIGDSATERLVHVHGKSRADATERLLSLFAEVGLGEGRELLRRYPHQLSGGMLQRVVIAAALSTYPQLLLADEPTSALDVTTQAEVLMLLRRLRRERSLGVLFITHDLHLAAAYCDRVYVMQEGAVVEHQPSETIFTEPRHEYTKTLIAAAPSLPEREPRDDVEIAR